HDHGHARAAGRRRYRAALRPLRPQCPARPVGGVRAALRRSAVQHLRPDRGGGGGHGGARPRRPPHPERRPAGSGPGRRRLRRRRARAAARGGGGDPNPGRAGPVAHGRLPRPARRDGGGVRPGGPAADGRPRPPRRRRLPLLRRPGQGHGQAGGLERFGLRGGTGRLRVRRRGRGGGGRTARPRPGRGGGGLRRGESGTADRRRRPRRALPGPAGPLQGSGGVPAGRGPPEDVDRQGGEEDVAPVAGGGATRAGGSAAVTTRGATLDMLREPGLTVERPLELSGQWFNELCLWLQSPIGALGNLGWPMVLIPEIIDSRYRLGDTAVQVYQRVEWFGPVPRRPFTASGHVGWVSARPGSFEAG